MSRIDSITAEQAARFPEWVDKYIQLGLSTEPADFEAATAAALRAYELCNLGKPMVVLRLSSPFAATVGGCIAWAMLRELAGAKVESQVRSQVGSQVGSQVRSQVESQVESQVWSQVESQVWSQVESQVGSQVGSQVWSQVGSQVGSQVRSQVESQVESQVWSQVRSQVESQVGSQVGSQVWSQVGSQVRSQVESQVESQVWSQVRSQVESQVGSQVGSQVRSQVGSQVWSQVGSQVRSQVGSQVWSAVSNDRGGAFWASWIAYIAFMRDVLGWEDPALDRFTIDEQLASSCGWVWWHENVLAISDRPSIIHRDAQGRLHCTDGPAIAYRDGWAIHSVHGVVVPADVIEDPSSVTVARISDEHNAEVRRVMIERYGASRYLMDSGAAVVHRDPVGILYRKELDSDEPIVMVRVLNSTPEPDGVMSREEAIAVFGDAAKAALSAPADARFKEYMIRVPPNVRTAHEAVAWTFGLGVNEYHPALET
jgi:uncharacterized protein DUF6745